jgi:hypothetical protein
MSAVTHNGIAAAAWWTALRGYLLMGVALTVVFFAASGFVLNTISTGVEVRGDRVTPAVELARRTTDTLTKSRQAECATRRSRCRDLEAPTYGAASAAHFFLAAPPRSPQVWPAP